MFLPRCLRTHLFISLHSPPTSPPCPSSVVSQVTDSLPNSLSLMTSLQLKVISTYYVSLLKGIYVTLVNVFYYLCLPPFLSPLPFVTSFPSSPLPSSPLPSPPPPLPSHSTLQRPTHLFPPSSKTTGVRCLAAACMTMRPTTVLPVKKILSKRCSNTASATSLPPVITQKHSYREERGGEGWSEGGRKETLQRKSVQ